MQENFLNQIQAILEKKNVFKAMILSNPEPCGK